MRVIAERLGVSERTVKRDLAMVKPYIEGQCGLLARQESMEIRRQFNCLSLKKQLEFVRKEGERWRIARRSLMCDALHVTVDVDAALDGRYVVRFKPCLPVDIVENGRITLELQVCEENRP